MPTEVSRSEHVLSYAAKEHRSWEVRAKESFTGAQNNLGKMEPLDPAGPPSCSKLGQ